MSPSDFVAVLFQVSIFFFLLWSCNILCLGPFLWKQSRELTSCGLVSFNVLVGQSEHGYLISVLHWFLFGDCLLETFTVKVNKCMAFMALQLSLKQLQSVNHNDLQ